MSSNISFVINEGTNSITGLFVSDIGDARSNEREFVTTFSAFNIDYTSRFLNIFGSKRGMTQFLTKLKYGQYVKL